MAASAGNGGCQESLTDGINLLVHHVKGELRLAAGVVSLGANGQVSGCNQLFRTLVVISSWHQVTGDLLTEKEVVRFILVKGGNHVVAVAPGVWVKHIRFLAA